MKISFNWLSEFVDIRDIDPVEVGHKLTMSTSEIEGIEEVGDDLESVVVGNIIEVTQHPQADKLFLTKIDVGNEVLDIISGAPNTKKGTHVPVALIGARLPGGTRVKKAKLRGVESNGIVCSERELGVSDDHTGLWILDDEAVKPGQLKPGVSVASLFPTRDYIIEIDNKSVTNRPDLWGHYGFARELAAIFGRKLAPVYTMGEIEDVTGAGGNDQLEIVIEDKDLCPRYSAIMLGGVKVKKSSYIVRRRLYTLGVRPIYNIVDVTNYVMLETGQPLHAFDATRISHEKIIVRRAKDGEHVTTLDGTDRVLTNEALLITDPEKAVAVAGVMGGLNSEISDLTEKIIIEAANFNPVNIRRTALRLGLRTEASNRFEKSLDPELTVLGIVGIVKMIKEMLPGASIVSPFIDADYSEKKSINIPLDTEWVARMLGVPVGKKRILDILRSLQFEVNDKQDPRVMVTVPSFRATKDVSIPNDLVEEVGRIYGYDNIDAELPQIYNEPPYEDSLVSFIRRIKRLFSSELSLSEVYTYSFYDDSILDLFYPEETPFLKLKNPISTSMARLRRSLIPGLYSLVEKNILLKNEFSIYEVGSVYNPGNRGLKKNQGLPDERQMASVLIVRKTKGASAFFELKGKLEDLFGKFDITGAEFRPFKSADTCSRCFDMAGIGIQDVYHQGRRAILVDGDTCFGFISELNPKILGKAGVDFNASRAAVFDIDLRLLMERAHLSQKEKKYKSIPKYPEVVLAFAVVVDEEVPVRGVMDFIGSCVPEREGSSNSLLDRVELFDIYRGKPLPEGKKNLAFNVFYRRGDRTLTEKEANVVHEDIAKRIRKHGWELR
jgi:phenylalanyl-tRNA synthetase beta chain